LLANKLLDIVLFKKRGTPGRQGKNPVFQDGQKYVSPKELAIRWGISLTAIYSYKAGTEALIRIPLGKSVRFLRSQIEKIEADRERKAKALMKHFTTE